jgi:hypothetical protein
VKTSLLSHPTCVSFVWFYWRSVFPNEKFLAPSIRESESCLSEGLSIKSRVHSKELGMVGSEEATLLQDEALGCSGARAPDCSAMETKDAAPQASAPGSNSENYSCLKPSTFCL